MQPFEHQEYYPPNTIEKLTKKIPQKNFLVDLNNLLSEKNLDSITPQMIDDLAKKYQVKNFHDKFHFDLNLFFKDFLNANLGKEDSQANDYKSAKKFQELLNLSEKEFKEMYNHLALSVFEKTMEETIKKNQKYGEEEENKFDSLIDSLKIDSENANEFVKKIRGGIANDFYQKIIEDRRVSPDEITQADKLAKDLQTNVTLDEKTKIYIDKLKRLWAIENEDLPSIEPDIIIQKSEVCYMQCKANLYENRKVMKNVGYAGPTFRLKIMKGVYYRAGNIGVNRHTENELTKIDEGGVYITNKRILFYGSMQNKTYRYNQIIDLKPFSDGVQLVKDTGKSPFFNPIDEDPEILLAILARVIKDTMA